MKNYSSCEGWIFPTKFLLTRYPSPKKNILSPTAPPPPTKGYDSLLSADTHFRCKAASRKLYGRKRTFSNSFRLFFTDFSRPNGQKPAMIFPKPAAKTPFGPDWDTIPSRLSFPFHPTGQLSPPCFPPVGTAKWSFRFQLERRVEQVPTILYTVFSFSIRQ